MVKADVKRDYYADLELPATADLEDIKRQFRLLAKQYHPDRNPGHEVEVVPKFQAVQAAHEVLSDAAEKAKYDAGRAKLARNAPPPPRESDPYNFRKPQQKQATAPPNFPFPPPPQQKPRQKSSFGQRPQASAGAEKFSAYTRAGPPTWDRQRFEDAARAEAAQRFPNMRPTQAPPQAPPPRPPRPHPTAPMSGVAAPSPDLPNAPNGVHPGFPGLARTASGRRLYEDSQRTSAYAYVRGDRPPPTTSQTYTPDAYPTYSPPMPKTRPAVSPLRHAKSSDQGVKSQNPFVERPSSRYASNVGERTNINGPGLARSSSVRNSPVDRRYEEQGPFGRPYSHHGPPRPRHQSASPKLRPNPGVPADFSSSSGSSDDEPLGMNQRPKAVPRRSRERAATNDGLEGQFPSTNYTRVVDGGAEQYHYPPPELKHPTRHPFPDMTSPDDAVAPNGGFSNVEPKTSAADGVFRAAQFSAEDWTERLKSASPTKRGSKSKRAPMSRSDILPDAMDLDPMEIPSDKTTHANGVDLNDLKNATPFTAAGLDNVDDLATNLPFESRASAKVPLDHTASARIKHADLPRPPKTVAPPSEDLLTQENWRHYVSNMNAYMREWMIFNGKMIAHFQSRHEQVSKGMSDNWISMNSDGPSAEQVDANGGAPTNGTPKAGYAAYMAWLDDDAVCHAWWDRANDVHRSCLEDLGRLREAIKAEWS